MDTLEDIVMGSNPGVK